MDQFYGIYLIANILKTLKIKGDCSIKQLVDGVILMNRGELDNRQYNNLYKRVRLKCHQLEKAGLIDLYDKKMKKDRRKLIAHLSF